MNGRILPFEGHAHRDVERMLPWYANATLEEAQTARVRQHLGECAGCRAELASLRALAAAVDGAMPVDDARETDRGWERMRHRLHATRRAPTPRRYRQRLREGWRDAAPWVRGALLAQCAVVAVLAAVLVRGMAPTPQATEPAFYTTLSAAPAPQASRDTLLVVFDPRLTDAQLRELLGANHARIVDGPNATGAFVVAAPPGKSQAVRDALRGSPGVAMAERLAPPE